MFQICNSASLENTTMSYVAKHGNIFSAEQSCSF